MMILQLQFEFSKSESHSIARIWISKTDERILKNWLPEYMLVLQQKFSGFMLPPFALTSQRFDNATAAHWQRYYYPPSYYSSLFWLQRYMG